MTDDTIIAGYHVVRRLGQGGMGTVYLVQNPVLPRHDALKVLSAELSYNRDFRVRFIREADLASQLTHPNIVSIYTRGETRGGQLWIAMEFVDGVDADAALRAGTMSPVRAVHIAGEVAKALDYAHRRNIVHRDVKPANFLLAGDPGEDERVLLGDFGIARALDDVGLTVTGSVLATVAYAAPEVLAGDPFDARADLYSLGCTLFRMLTGKTPFADAHGTAAVMVAHLEQPPPRVTDRAPWLPPGLNEVIATAMAKDPAQRFQTARELVGAAADAISDRTTPRDVMRRPLPGDEVASYPPTPGSLPPWWRYPSASNTQMAPPAAPGPGSARPAQLSATVQPTAAPQIPARRTRVRRRWIVGAVMAVSVLLVGALTAALTMGGRDQHSAAGDPNAPTGQPTPSTASASASASPAPAPTPVPPVLLSPDEISAIMISPGLQFRANQNALLDDSPEIDAKDCVGAWMAAQKVVYDGTGWNEAGVQSLGQPQQAMWDLGVVQAVVTFPSPELAQKFFADQDPLWSACANRTVTITPTDHSPVQTWTFGNPRNVDAMLTIRYHQGSDGGGCQRALTVRGSTAIDITACDSDPMIENRAATIAGNIAGKAP